MPTPNITVDQLVEDKSFRAWTEGRAGADEKKKWDRWVQQSTKNRRLARRAQQAITGFSFASSTTPHTSEAWERLQRGIAGHSRSPLSAPSGVPRRQKSWIYYGVAASILVVIMVGLSGLLMRSSNDKSTLSPDKRTIQTAYGERKKITLSNGASIVLNAHSRLTYVANQLKSKTLRVSLRGEAYFTTAEHARPARRAFRIQTPDGAISDLGTQFVVSTRKARTRVILKRGQVAIDQSSGNSKKPVLLHPGQMATFSKTSPQVKRRMVNPAVYTSWTTNELLFDRTPLAAIATRLEHTFGKEVIICEPGLAQRSLSGSIENGGLPVMLSALANALNTSYTITAGTVYIGRGCP